MRDNKKADTSKNGDGVATAIKAQHRREQKLHPLRINAQTIILVPRGKCNKKYAQEYQKKINRVNLY